MLVEILKSEAFGTLVTNLVIMLAVAVIPVIGAAIRGFINSKANDTRFSLLMDIARTAVLAAEQAGLNGVIEDKKEAAIQMAQAMLSDRGLKVDLTALDAAIEAAVADELNRPEIEAASITRATDSPEGAGA